MASSKNRKKRSQAPVALVYFVTMLLFFGVIAFFSVILLKNYGLLGNDNDSSEPEMISPSFSTLYARVNSKGVLADMSFVRVSPQKQTMTVVPISAYTVSKGGNTMREIFEAGGVVKLQNAVEDTFDISIDNYVTVSNEAFEKVADLFGGISYTPDQELYYLSQENDENDISLVKGELVNLSGRQIRLLCQYPVFDNGKEGNMKFLGYAVTQIINSAFQQSVIAKDNLDNLYRIITENSDTNLSEDDFTTQKAYIKQMLDANVTPANTLCPEGSWSDESHFTVSGDFVSSLNEAVNDGTVNINENSEAADASAVS